VAVVDAFADPNISADLASFDRTFGLSAPPSLSVDAPFGTNATTQSTLELWRLEESLDVEWVHSIAPGANLALVEARSDSLADLRSAIGYAVSTLHASVISLSWGGGEFSGENSFDATTFPNNSGVMFVAAAGDSGSGAMWPSVSPNVVSVGGTTLSSTATGDSTSSHTTCSGTGTGSNGGLETAWFGSGGGISAFESIPGYQSSYSGPVHGASSISTLTTGKRATPDVAAIADPNTGVAAYDTAGYLNQTGWFQLGGTSLATPVWAGLLAIADQQRVAQGAPDLSIGAGDGTSPTYRIAPAAYTDIISGRNGFCGVNCTAGAGYDLVTGVGSPIGTGIRPRGPVTQSPVVSPTGRLPVAQSPGNTPPGPRMSAKSAARFATLYKSKPSSVRIKITTSSDVVRPDWFLFFLTIWLRLV
jgi:subtilase family serine protease